MLLPANTRLGPYAVVAPVGAGGMGEVYRAWDSRLERHVAIKLLNEELASDERARSRFRKEARAIAALAHPNILSVYDAELVHPLFSQTAPKHQPSETKAASSLVTKPRPELAVVRPRPNMADFETYDAYTEALVAWTIDQRLMASDKQIVVNPAPAPGRYQIVINPNVRADTWLLDTQTGRVWRLTVYPELKGDPDVWKFMTRVDSDQELATWAAQYPAKKP